MPVPSVADEVAITWKSCQSEKSLGLSTPWILSAKRSEFSESDHPLLALEKKLHTNSTKTSLVKFTRGGDPRYRWPIQHYPETETWNRGCDSGESVARKPMAKSSNAFGKVDRIQRGLLVYDSFLILGGELRPRGFWTGAEVAEASDSTITFVRDTFPKLTYLITVAQRCVDDIWGRRKHGRMRGNKIPIVGRLRGRRDIVPDAIVEGSLAGRKTMF
ncbi:hypothetical protein C8R47DRAFT_1068010 [Mycena vitilis]|nr:hypothetical protein C8R47DRAFT_1068010 [Mycena vitilis]